MATPQCAAPLTRHSIARRQNDTRIGLVDFAGKPEARPRKGTRALLAPANACVHNETKPEIRIGWTHLRSELDPELARNKGRLTLPKPWHGSQHNNFFLVFGNKMTRSSSREVRIRVPFFCSLL